MLAYTLKRLLAGLVTVLFIATATFAAMHAVPGDPLASGKARNPAIVANLKARYGLDRPVLVQYGIFLRNMAKGDFGISFTQQNRSVNDIIREHFPVSAVLGVLSLLFATVGGIVPTSEAGSVYVVSGRLTGVVRHVVGPDPDYTHARVE